MHQINNSETVKKQYASAEKLGTRIGIHTKYSVNRQGFGHWIFEQYELFPGCSILELGCGSGEMWADQTLPEGARLTLTDFSAGMLEAAQKNLKDLSGVVFEQVDAQQIPYADGVFDVVIANMMLYHVPDMGAALKEIRRVLKPGGKFYCATFGENGIAEYLQAVFSDYAALTEANRTFTLQNGGGILAEYFDTVEKRLYEDSLQVTESDDLIDYMFSLSSMGGLMDVPRGVARERLNARKVNGKIHVPKEYGLFVCVKA